MDALTPDTYNTAESLIGPHPYDGLDAEAAARLLQRLLKRGIICGDARTLGVAQARLPPRILEVPSLTYRSNTRWLPSRYSSIRTTLWRRRPSASLAVRPAEAVTSRQEISC